MAKKSKNHEKKESVKTKFSEQILKKLPEKAKSKIK